MLIFIIATRKKLEVILCINFFFFQIRMKLDWLFISLKTWKWLNGFSLLFPVTAKRAFKSEFSHCFVFDPFSNGVEFVSNV